MLRAHPVAVVRADAFLAVFHDRALPVSRSLLLSWAAFRVCPAVTAGPGVARHAPATRQAPNVRAVLNAAPTMRHVRSSHSGSGRAPGVFQHSPGLSNT